MADIQIVPAAPGNGHRRQVWAAALALPLAAILARPGLAAGLPITNPDFSLVYQADANGNALSSGGNPIAGTMTPGAYSDGISPVHISGITDIPTLGSWGAISFTDGTHYTNAGSENASLALVVPGWTQSTPGNQGTQVAAPGMFTTGQTTFLYVNGPGFGGPAGGEVIYQDLGPASSVLAPDSQYTFSVQVGARGDYGYTLASPILAGLFVGSAPSVIYAPGGGATTWTLPSELPLSGDDTPVPGAGQFVTWTKTYATGAAIPGGDVYLLLGTIADAPVTGDQVDFTGVQLDGGVSPYDAAAVPEPHTMGLATLATGALLIHVRRRRVTAAAVGW